MRLALAPRGIGQRASRTERRAHAPQSAPSSALVEHRRKPLRPCQTALAPAPLFRVTRCKHPRRPLRPVRSPLAAGQERPCACQCRANRPETNSAANSSGVVVSWFSYAVGGRVTTRREKMNRASPANRSRAPAISESLPAPDGPTTSTSAPQLTSPSCPGAGHASARATRIPIIGERVVRVARCRADERNCAAWSHQQPPRATRIEP